MHVTRHQICTAIAKIILRHMYGVSLEKYVHSRASFCVCLARFLMLLNRPNFLMVKIHVTFRGDNVRDSQMWHKCCVVAYVNFLVVFLRLASVIEVFTEDFVHK